MEKGKSPIKKSPVPSSDQESGSIGNAQAMNKTLPIKKRQVLPTDQERRSVSASTMKESLLPIKKQQERSNASLRIGNAEASEIERKSKRKGKDVMQERKKGKEREAVETTGMEARNPTKKEVEDDERRVTAIIKKWKALQWNYAYTSTGPFISKSSYKLEFKRDEKLRNYLLAGDKAAVLEKDGLLVPTVDDKGRSFGVVLKQSRGYLMLTGEGWSELVQHNYVEMRRVFQLYSYREGCLKFGIFFKIPRRMM